jgi:Na+/H+-translocating membrane pyrophosphatase
MNKEFHKPFIKSLIVVAVVTLVTMVSSRYVANYYTNTKFYPAKTIEYSSQKSQEQVYSSVVE